MSRDKLEKFILENRNEFDDLEPNPRLFEGVKTRKPKVFLGKWNSAAWKAAAAVAIFVASYFFHDWMSTPQTQQMAESGQLAEEPSEIFKVLMEAEMYYTAQINSRKEEFFKLSSGYPEIRDEVNYELVELDSIYAELKRDLRDNAANQEVIEAMIQNYRIKLDILEDVLRQMHAAKNEENEKEKRNETQL